MTLALQSTGPWSPPPSLTHHPKYYFQDSLTTFLVSSFARPYGPLHRLTTRFRPLQVESQLFRVHRCEPMNVLLCIARVGV